ncbi:hypothetical protein [Bradyrhizobium diazoefficiens]|nr:hypothetical protein XF16B_45740 [Bradyrhizobium diazoefficiens]BCF70227.1 hypothetical protein XF19B_45800 [Bradyrhizobium diazoefficiens]
MAGYLEKHDPADRCTCSYCGIAEDIHLLDGILDKRGNDTGKLACIACYPNDSWCCGSIKMVKLSIAPSLKPFYDQYVASEQWNARR